MNFEGKVGRYSGVFGNDDVLGVLDRNGENLLLPQVEMSCLFKLSRQCETSIQMMFFGNVIHMTGVNK